MNTKGKKMAASLLVCGSLLASVALIAVYPMREGSISPTHAAVDANGLTADGYYTGPLKRGTIDETQTPSVSTDWHANVPVLQKKVTLHLTDADLSGAITALAKMTGLNFASAEMGGQARFTLQMTHVPVWQVMQAMADACGGSWQRDHGSFTLRLRPIT